MHNSGNESTTNLEEARQEDLVRGLVAVQIEDTVLELSSVAGIVRHGPADRRGRRQYGVLPHETENGWISRGQSDRSRPPYILDVI